MQLRYCFIITAPPWYSRVKRVNIANVVYPQLFSEIRFYFVFSWKALLVCCWVMGDVVLSWSLGGLDAGHVAFTLPFLLSGQRKSEFTVLLCPWCSSACCSVEQPGVQAFTNIPVKMSISPATTHCEVQH